VGPYVWYINALFLVPLIIIMNLILNDPQYAGILCALQPSSTDASGAQSPDAPAQDEIDDDIDGEMETIDFQELPGEEMDGEGPDTSGSELDGSEDEDGDSKMPDITLMQTIISAAS
jgi:hypothetical protein